MKSASSWRWGFVASVAVVAFVSWQAKSPQAEPEPAAVLGPDACGECHTSEVEVWKGSHHALGFAELQKSPRAAEIMERMGIRRLKTATECTGCHYTIGQVDGRDRAIAGVSCESCHGASRDWIKVHDDFGAGAEKSSESAAHAQERYQRAAAAGMIWPAQIDRLAERCFDCHIIKDAKLVEEGGHPVATDFELVAWTQGEMRHNFAATEGRENQFATPTRQCELFLVGAALDLAASLDGLAANARISAHAEAMLSRIMKARATLTAIKEKLSAEGVVAGLGRILAASEGFDRESWPARGVATATASAAAIRKEIGMLVQAGLQSSVGGIESLLPSSAAFKGVPSKR